MPFAPTTGFAGPLSVFIPSFQGKQTANLVVSFARDPKKFAVNKLVTRTPTNVLAANYMVLRPEALARRSASLWVDGQQRPAGTHNEQDFRAVPYVCERIAKSAPLGWQTRDQAVWPIQDTQLGALGHMIMTERAQNFYTEAMTTANHLSTHVKTATAWSGIGGTGGLWSAGTSSNPIIDRTLKQMAEAIRKDTLDAVSYLDLALVITPPIAIAMSTAAEIHDYVARSPFAQAQVKGDAPNFNYQWGLPEKLYGFTVIVDGTLKTTSSRLQVPGTFVDIPGQATSDAADNSALVCALPGDLGSNVGQVNSAFSTFHMFVYNGEEMIVETQDEPWHKRTMMSVSETYKIKLVAPETAAIATNLFS